MIVMNLVEDLRRMIAAVPQAATAAISIGCYVDDARSELSLQRIGSYIRDDDGDFNLVPLGIGANLDLAEQPWTVEPLLQALESRPDVHAAPLYVHYATKMSGTYIASLGAPALGVGLDDAAGAYVLYGETGYPESN
ncbi:hypothetical protein [Nevskia sp.]|uniref:hypothetical protein n=1 Tax=Nevskia sp. TaxID=1929292 RepID=UPI0025F93BB1|nr:hypothetical protein [Nevskia sp.]